MRVLVCAHPMLGHLNPMVPLSWALRADGHEVLVATPAGFATTVAQRGLAVTPLSDVDMHGMMARDREGRPVPPDQDPVGRVLRSGRGWGRLGAAQLDETITVVARWRPDLVVVDPVQYAGRLAAARLGMPWVEHGWGLWPDPRFALAAGQELAPELAQLGLPGLPEPAWRLDVLPAGLQRPGIPAQPMRYVPVAGPATLPRWLDQPSRLPMVCLTFGSLLPRMATVDVLDLTGQLMRALPELDTEVVVAMDPAQVEQLGPLTSRVRAAGWLPLDHVLPSCSAVVHYGGSGTMMTALAAGVPQVVVSIPVADAPDNAALVAAAGIGICLPAADLRAETVAAACDRVLLEPAWRARGAAIAAELGARPHPQAVAGLLAERFAAR
jgi:UDP:flavonoid glycosyltransferase YjiC (YdhE family)